MKPWLGLPASSERRLTCHKALMALRTLSPMLALAVAHYAPVMTMVLVRPERCLSCTTLYESVKLDEPGLDDCQRCWPSAASHRTDGQHVDSSSGCRTTLRIAVHLLLLAQAKGVQ